MHVGRTVFSQIVEVVPHWLFQRLAQRHDQASGRMKFKAWEHFLALGFAQLTFLESLRDIKACLGAQPRLAYHLGFRSRVARSTLADANEQRDWRLFAELAHWLMPRARELYADEPHALDLDAPVYALDSSLIDLSLALCPWANWTGTDAAVKLHTLLELRGPLPAFVAVTHAEQGDSAIIDQMPVEPGSFYVMDRGYIDLLRLSRMAAAGAFFVVRERDAVRYYVRQSRAVDRAGHLRSDQTIRFTGEDSRRHWPGVLRRVSVFDAEHHRRLAFWINNWVLPAATVAELYRQRWQIELFFRWIKQNLRIRAFYGTSPNAIRVQLWSAICAYLCVAITRKRLRLIQNFTTVLQIVSVHALHKVPMDELFAENNITQSQMNTPEQLIFSEL